jgi:hypothetical protein
MRCNKCHQHKDTYADVVGITAILQAILNNLNHYSPLEVGGFIFAAL